MGCWNATCNVSRLPIFCGDEIVVIPLIAVSATVTANTSYATDNFVPFSFPIVGKYNDYGGIEDAVITEENDKLIRSYELVFSAIRTAKYICRHSRPAASTTSPTTRTLSISTLLVRTFIV